MRSARKTTIAVALVGASLIVQGAFAHGDPTSDSSRCDTWYRPGHGSNAPTDYPDTHQGDSHHHESSSDRTVAGSTIAATTIHAHSGHYVVRHQAGYVEVVGGQSYSGPASAGYGQGGWVQGEVDPGIGQDADFHANVFGPAEPNAPVGERGNTGGQVCASSPIGRHSTSQITIPTGG